MVQKTRFFPVVLLAIAATLAGCEKEHQASGIPDSRKPFVIHVLNEEGTRGEAISAVSSFRMVGVQGSSDKWMDNFLFKNPGSGWVAAGHEDLCWPDGADKHTFYATCDNTDDAPAITDGTFVYIVPERIRDQKDLLVALSENNESGTPVALSFKHALSSVKFKIGFDMNQLGGDEDSHIKVTQITLYHIATKGTFDFANYATNPWTVDPEDAEYKDFVITLKQPVEFVPSILDYFKNLDGNYIDETSIGEIYVMPHKPVAWDTDGTAGHPLNNSYIGVTCQFFEYTGYTFRDMYGLDETSDEDEYEDAKEEYLGTYEGQASTDNDDWLDDKQISVLVPTNDEYTMNVVLESILNKRNEDAAANGTSDNYEEVYIPLTMANGFGFGKTNVINIRMDKMKYSTGKDIFVPFTPIVP